jgi:hypothetical protein
MPLGSAWPVPFILGPQHLEVGAVTSFCVSVLLAVMVNAEAQAFVSTFLGDVRQNPKDRLHFNAFLHLSFLGTICYLAGGFGWPRTMEIDRSKFRYPRLYMVISRSVGPLANLLLAGIAGSLASIMKSFEYNPRVFLMVIGVNITTAVYSLIPLPPLAAGFLASELLPLAWTRTKWLFLQSGPFIILALVLLGRISHQETFAPYFDPIIVAIFNYIKS